MINILKGLVLFVRLTWGFEKTELYLKEIYLNLINGNETPKHLLHGSSQEEFTLQHGAILKDCGDIIYE